MLGIGSGNAPSFAANPVAWLQQHVNVAVTFVIVTFPNIEQPVETKLNVAGSYQVHVKLVLLETANFISVFILTPHVSFKPSTGTLFPVAKFINDASFMPPAIDAPPWLFPKVFGKEINWKMASPGFV